MDGKLYVLDKWSIVDMQGDAPETYGQTIVPVGDFLWLSGSEDSASSYLQAFMLPRREPWPSEKTFAVEMASLFDWDTLVLDGGASDSIPGAASLAFAGGTFTVLVTKTDHYGQTIRTDSSSLMQAKTSLAGARSLDASVQLLGTTIAAMLAGTASFNVAVKPSFFLVNASSETTSLLRAANVYFEGTDVEVAGQMLSDVYEISLFQNRVVCPQGYVLSLDAANADGSQPGQCAVCLAGTYSLHPLAGGSATTGPSCRPCPSGGVCSGGDVVTFAVGNWSVVNSVWQLDSCPSGYAATTSKDGCVVCAAGKYSLREGVDQECLTCPAGGDCIAGGDVVTFAVGNWSIVDEAWVLQMCPSGYAATTSKDGCVVAVENDGQLQYQLDSCPSGYVFSTNADGCVACEINFYSLGFRNESSVCAPCPTGGVCSGGEVVAFAVGNWGVVNSVWQLDSCPSGYAATTSKDGCVVCAAGKYSLREGVDQECLTCPAGGDCIAGGDVVTFAVGNWSIVDEVWVLQMCPSGYAATTSKDGCVVCAAGKYSLQEGVDHECVTCPAGGDCIAGGDVVTFAVGTWSVVDDLWKLFGCPSGYATNSAQDRCVKCESGTYSLQSGLGFSCYTCPTGGDCGRGGDQTTFEVGDWTVEAFMWALQSCPSGYAPNTGSTKDECIRCEAGTYSLAEGLSHACLPCPQGGTCAGGSQVQLDGDWKLVDNAWELTYCPSGSQATTAKDGCVVCAAGKYSLSVGVDQECKPCPAGGDCIKGGHVTTFAIGVWSVVEVNSTVNGVLDKRWNLDSCPSGYAATTSKDGCVLCPAGKYSLSVGLDQECKPCPAGGDCIEGGNVTAFAVGNWNVVTVLDKTPEHLDGVLDKRWNLSSCPAGNVFATSSDACVRCEPGFFSLGARASKTPCLPCPAGGDCLAGGNVVTFPLGTWSVVNNVYVLQSCPMGHELTASNAADECVPCPADSIKLDVGLSKCKNCPAGTTCGGGGGVYPRPGFWVDPDVVSGKAPEFAPLDLVVARFYEEDGANRRDLVLSGDAKAGRVQDVKDNGNLVVRFNDGAQQEITRDMVTSSSLPTYRCQGGACTGGENFSCAQGHHGPVCGLCNETRDENGVFYSWSGSSCQQCQEESGVSVLVWVLMAIIALIIWFYISWMPLVGCDIFGAPAAFECIVQRIDKCDMFTKAVQMASGFAALVAGAIKAVMPYSKLIISYFQVVSTFIKTFAIDWPPEIFAFLASMNILNFDIFSLPAMTCFVSDWDYPTMLTIETCLPLVVLALLAIPSCIAYGMARNGSRVARQRFEETVSSFAWWGLFLNWMVSDMRVACPVDSPSGFAFIYSLVFICVYPLGVPLLFAALLFYYQVPKMAKQKNKAERIRALLAAFRQEVEAGKEEGITGRELERWWKAPGGWKADPVEAIGGKAQLKAVLRHTWRDHTGADAEEHSASRGVFNKLSVDKEAHEKFKDDQTEKGDDLDFASLDSLRRKVNRLAAKGLAQAPKGMLVWNGELGDEEERAMRRAGFLFLLYEVEYWWFELFEMLRKLTMTTVLVFVASGTLGQIVFGLIVICLAFVVTFALTPYVSPNLDRCQLFSLGTQFVVLQYGLVLHLDGTSLSSQAEKNIINGIMILVEKLPGMREMVVQWHDKRLDPTGKGTGASPNFAPLDKATGATEALETPPHLRNYRNTGSDTSAASDFEETSGNTKVTDKDIQVSCSLA
ncbi:hypothetical protein T484DRAFT_1801045 [Baffinella frigidus]|nr:hypothetical protein T484DRAFT_1801045 [Cryptophyta sp. CCMP2293]